MINYYLQACVQEKKTNILMDYLEFLCERSSEEILPEVLKKFIEYTATLSTELSEQYEQKLSFYLGHDLVQYVPVHTSTIPYIMNECYERGMIDYMILHYKTLNLSYSDALQYTINLLTEKANLPSTIHQSHVLHENSQSFVRLTSDAASVKILYKMLESDVLPMEHTPLALHMLKQKKLRDIDKYYLSYVCMQNPRPYLVYAYNNKISLAWLPCEVREHLQEKEYDMYRVMFDPMNTMGIHNNYFDLEKEIAIHCILLLEDRPYKVWNDLMQNNTPTIQALLAPYCERYFDKEDATTLALEFYSEYLGIPSLKEQLSTYINGQEEMLSTLDIKFSVLTCVQEFLNIHRGRSHDEIDIHL